MTTTAVVLAAHGTVDALDDLPELLRNIRRGNPAPPELLHEVRRRYEAIGGQSPLNAINREVARKLEARLGIDVRLANRLFRPYPRDVLAELAARGANRIVAVPLAQHSAHVYGASVVEAAKGVAGIERVDAAPNWGRHPALLRAFADRVREALQHTRNPREAVVVYSAHSLPKAIIAAGDAYETEFRASVEGVGALVPHEHVVCFQSAGMSGGEWLGPDLRATLEALAKRGTKEVVLAPIGFLADHVEILYDLDIEARSWAEGLGIVTYRSASLNASDALVDALASVVENVASREGG